MPQYFDINDGERRTRDAEATEPPDREATRKEAISVQSDIDREELPNGDDHVFACSIRDQSGTAICMARLSLHAAWRDEQGASGK